jgi:DNA-binding transcriptional MerR regulator
MSQLRIGDLARLGGVSVRMLRHYHEIGLLVPAAIDGQTGYRYYDQDQVEVLEHVVLLKDLGLQLAQIAEMLPSPVSDEKWRALLIERRTAVLEEIGAAKTNLARLDEHLSQLQEEHEMSAAPKPSDSIEVEVKSVAPRLVAQLSGLAESWAPEHIGPVIQPLYPELTARMEQAGIAQTGPSTAWYEDTDEGRVLAHATLTIGERPTADQKTLGFEVVELPALDRVASTIHRGTMADGDTTYQRLLEWITDHDLQPIGYSREIDIECGPDNAWVVELQLQVEPA